MKKLFLLLIVLLPLSVNAMAYSETFRVGDSVTVGLKSDDDNVGFHVLKESASGETYVTLIYDGVIEGSPSVYDESNPDENYEATYILDNSIVGKKLQEVINKDGAKWRVESARLLNENDLSNLNIRKNDAGIYEISEKYSFLAPVKDSNVTSEMYNYWTSIRNTNSATTAMYCVTYNDNRTEDTGVWATLESKDITSITNNSTCAIRPVVVIDKAYILCNNTVPENVKTGVKDYIIPLSALLITASALIVISKKKTVFKEI